MVGSFTSNSATYGFITKFTKFFNTTGLVFNIS